MRELWVAPERGEPQVSQVSTEVPDPQEKQDPPDIVHTVTLPQDHGLRIIYNWVPVVLTPKAEKITTFVNSITIVISFICTRHTFSSLPFVFTVFGFHLCTAFVHVFNWLLIL